MTRRARVLAVLVGLTLAAGGTLAAVRLLGEDEGPRQAGDVVDGRRLTLFSPEVSGQPRVPRALPGYEPCPHPGPGCGLVELTIARYAALVGASSRDYSHDVEANPSCPRPEGPEEGAEGGTCDERPENVTVTLVMRDADARRFIAEQGCGEPVIDPCW